jgi:GT2 family glycosyltransferase
VAVVVPVHNDVSRTVRFLESFSKVEYPDYTLIVVDDGSTDGTAATLSEQFPGVIRVAGTGNLWWAGSTNRGVRWALRRCFEYVLTINNDTEVAPSFLRFLVETAERHPRAIVGCRIEFIDRPGVAWAHGSEMNWQKGEIFHLRDSGRRAAPGPRLLRVEALTGCGTLVPTQCYREIGGYDAIWFPQYHADAEFILRARGLGWTALVDTRAVVCNDARNTAADKVGNWVGWILSRRSAVYWRPLLAIHLRYCPHRWRLRSIWQFYGWYFWQNDERVRKLGWMLRPLTKWWNSTEAAFAAFHGNPKVPANAQSQPGDDISLGAKLINRTAPDRSVRQTA